ncbi:MAG TPA: hypothetical protein VHU81_04945 [Thermoanaerobaculia bacterium]|jgi:hypothetical protein|nr:hypothetical protein [Thermoanaerobaculia bacterium]
MIRRHVFHVVCFQDRGWWVAQCLERNLTASAKDPEELQEKLETVLKVQAEADLEAGKVPFSALPPAPRRFWTLFQSAEPWRLDGSMAAIPTGAPAWTEVAIA